jgi:DNA invertase Pin-like site-specific DNA recombinase
MVMTRVDRLARSDRLVGHREKARGVRRRPLRHAHPEPRRGVIDTRSATGRLILTIFGGFAQFEREIMLQRQCEGIHKAQAAGRYLGRKPSASSKADEAVSMVQAGKALPPPIGHLASAVQAFIGR